MSEEVRREQVVRGSARSVAGEPVERVERVERERNVYGATAPSTANVNVDRAAARRPVAVAPDYATLAVAKVTQLLWFVCGVLELLLTVRVVLLLLGANRATPFAQFIYSVTQPFAYPFLGLFPAPATTAQRGSVFEVTTVLAMVAYFLLFLLLTQLLRLLVSRPRVVA